MKISPREANTESKICALKTDNRSLKGCWILIDGGRVTIAKQRTGEDAILVNLSKREFNALIDWYNKEQK